MRNGILVCIAVMAVIANLVVGDVSNVRYVMLTSNRSLRLSFRDITITNNVGINVASTATASQWPDDVGWPASNAIRSPTTDCSRTSATLTPSSWLEIDLGTDVTVNSVTVVCCEVAPAVCGDIHRVQLVLMNSDRLVMYGSSVMSFGGAFTSNTLNAPTNFNSKTATAYAWYMLPDSTLGTLLRTCATAAGQVKFTSVDGSESDAAFALLDSIAPVAIGAAIDYHGGTSLDWLQDSTQMYDLSSSSCTSTYCNFMSSAAAGWTIPMVVLDGMTSSTWFAASRAMGMLCVKSQVTPAATARTPDLVYMSRYLGSTSAAVGSYQGAGKDVLIDETTAMVAHSNGTIYYVTADNKGWIMALLPPNGEVFGPIGTTTLGTADGNGNDAKFSYIYSLALDETNGVMYVGDNGWIRKIVLSTLDVTVFIGRTLTGCIGGDVNSARFGEVSAMAVVNFAGTTELVTADRVNGVLYRVRMDQTASIWCGACLVFAVTDGTTTAARFDRPIHMAYAARFSAIYSTSATRNSIRKTTVPGGVVTTIDTNAGSISMHIAFLDDPLTQDYRLFFGADSNFRYKRIASDGTVGSTKTLTTIGSNSYGWDDVRFSKLRGLTGVGATVYVNGRDAAMGGPYITISKLTAS